MTDREAPASSVSVSDAARHLGVTEGTVRYRIKHDLLRFVTDSRGRVRVPQDEIDRLLQTSRIDGADELGLAREESAKLLDALRSVIAAREQTSASIRAALDAERVLLDALVASLGPLSLPDHPEVTDL